MLAALGDVAALHDYTKPLMTADGELSVTEAGIRSSSASSADPFVPNDINLNGRRSSS